MACHDGGARTRRAGARRNRHGPGRPRRSVRLLVRRSGRPDGRGAAPDARRVPLGGRAPGAWRWRPGRVCGDRDRPPLRGRPAAARRDAGRPRAGCPVRVRAAPGVVRLPALPRLHLRPVPRRVRGAGRPDRRGQGRRGAAEGHQAAPDPRWTDPPRLRPPGGPARPRLRGGRRRVHR